MQTRVSVPTEREQNWFERWVSTEDENRFSKLRDLHALTLAWIAHSGKRARPVPYELARGPERDAEIARVVPLLEWIHLPNEDVRLATLLDDTAPGDLLARLEMAARAVQVSTVATLLEAQGSGSADRDAARARLDQLSWDTGRAARARLVAAGSNGRPRREGPHVQLSLLFQSLRATPLWGVSPATEPLVRRWVPAQVDFELRACPHGWAEIVGYPAGTVDEICRQHFHWLRGYVYAAAPGAQATYRSRNEAPARARCAVGLSLRN